MITRTRIGLMVPATNSTAEPDFAMVAPRNVSIHAQRMWNDDELNDQIKKGTNSEAGHAAHYEGMNSDVERAARYLVPAKMDLIVYACTTGSFFMGPGYDKELIQRIENAAGVPAVATAPSATAALRSLGAKKISVASPYTKWQNDKLRAYYEAAGFEVLNVEGDPRGAVAGGQGHCDLSAESVLEFAAGVCRPEADALFCSCTAWRSMEVVAELEQRTGKPVVSANQATVWAAFTRLGFTGLLPGFGSLLDPLVRVAV